MTLRTASLLLVLTTFMAIVAPWAKADQRALLDWEQLADASKQHFDDPFRGLASEHLINLAAIVRLQERLTSGSVASEERQQLEAQIFEKQAALEAAGVDAARLIAQRWLVADRREKAAVAVNVALDGEIVEIGGFLIPAPDDEDGRRTAYLVAARGMCSHTPPPPPNRLLRLVSKELPGRTRLYEPVVVRGRLNAVQTKREFVLVDGPVLMWSAWTLEPESVEAFQFEKTPAQGRFHPLLPGRPQQ